ncbi:MAG TPA: hypothetical protein VF618_06380 [Thermoanaerobaculia bacterium]
MAKDRNNTGGPSQSPKDTPTDDRDNRKVQSRDEMSERAVSGDRPGDGRRNGSDKAPRG